jgi:hypothetical protein
MIQMEPFIISVLFTLVRVTEGFRFVSFYRISRHARYDSHSDNVVIVGFVTFNWPHKIY